MSAYLITFCTLAGLSAVILGVGYLLAIAAAVTFDTAVGRLTMPGPTRVATPTAARWAVPAWRTWRGGAAPVSRWA